MKRWNGKNQKFKEKKVDYSGFKSGFEADNKGRLSRFSLLDQEGNCQEQIYIKFVLDRFVFYINYDSSIKILIDRKYNFVNKRSSIKNLIYGKLREIFFSRQAIVFFRIRQPQI